MTEIERSVICAVETLQRLELYMGSTVSTQVTTAWLWASGDASNCRPQGMSPKVDILTECKGGTLNDERHGKGKRTGNKKQEQLKEFTWAPEDTALTSNQGVAINNDVNSLKAGARGPSLLEDHIMREKIMHFDHERIPERVVHARGAAAHGVFESTGEGAKYSKAAFLQKGAVTPVFTRFSTVAGSRGSSDLARDVRGFATKFYTEEGVFDLVGNNMPVFFIQDAIKFPDFIHAVKPEPHNEIPQAQSAHDTFWDFVSISTEATHMVMWVMSDRAIPRSFATMEGFGVHTFRLIDAKGKSRFVKFHWKPTAGVHSVLWDEALKISGKDPDFHRRDLWNSIEQGQFPEWELGLQIVEEEDEFKFDFDLLDPTKLIPEELVPVIKVGKMTLNRNPENFFAETEQVAYCVSHIVPGIDFTNDPLMQGRLFSYPDTQLKRLGGPNFHEIPINKSLAPVSNNQRDGHMRQTINPGRASYHPNTVGGGCPFQAAIANGGFASFAAEVSGPKVRDRFESFFDHFSQAKLFYNSQTDIEKQHIIDAIQFELSHVVDPQIRQRMVGVLQKVNKDLAKSVAGGLSIDYPVAIEEPLNKLYPEDADPKKYQPKEKEPAVKSSKALSILANPVVGAKGKNVAILVADGFAGSTVKSLQKELTALGANAKLVGVRAGEIADDAAKKHPADFWLASVGSVLFEAVFVPGGRDSVSALGKDARTKLFIAESYKHFKAIGAAEEGVKLVTQSLADLGLGEKSADLLTPENGVTLDSKGGPCVAKSFADAVAQPRSYGRKMTELIPV
jgi:catalase